MGWFDSIAQNFIFCKAPAAKSMKASLQPSSLVRGSLNSELGVGVCLADTRRQSQLPRAKCSASGVELFYSAECDVSRILGVLQKFCTKLAL